MQVCYTCFVPNAVKAGGVCEMAVGAVKKLDELNRCIVLTDGRAISVNDLLRKNS